MTEHGAHGIAVARENALPTAAKQKHALAHAEATDQEHAKATANGAHLVVAVQMGNHAVAHIVAQAQLVIIIITEVAQEALAHTAHLIAISAHIAQAVLAILLFAVAVDVLITMRHAHTAVHLTE